jgi:hypothetical protein
LKKCLKKNRWMAIGRRFTTSIMGHGCKQFHNFFSEVDLRRS